MRNSGRDKEGVEFDIRIGRVGGREHRRVLKKGDIDRDKVSMCIKRVAAISSLKSGITEEDTLHDFG